MPKMNPMSHKEAPLLVVVCHRDKKFCWVGVQDEALWLNFPNDERSPLTTFQPRYLLQIGEQRNHSSPHQCFYIFLCDVSFLDDTVFLNQGRNFRNVGSRKSLGIILCKKFCERIAENTNQLLTNLVDGK